MRVYVGQGNMSRGCKMVRRIADHGWGVCVCPGELLPPVVPQWFADNGAFRSWRAGKPWDVDAFEAFVGQIVCGKTRPDFIVAPDVVGDGLASVILSREWVPRLRSSGLATYLAVQDGMEPYRIPVPCDGVFVGGTVPWKIATGERWTRLAHAEGVPCHIGRCGTPNRVKWARRIGADSIDSSLPLWSKDNMRRFVEALDDPQMELGA